MGEEDHRDMHAVLIVLLAWTAASVPSAVLIGRRLAAHPAVVRVGER